MSTHNRNNDAEVVAQAIALARDSQLLPLLRAALLAAGPAGTMLTAKAREVLTGAAAAGAIQSRYLVSWTIDIDDAESAREAAERARDCQVRPGTTATCFTVVDNATGFSHEVDLEGDSPIPVRLTRGPFDDSAQEGRR